MSSIYSRFTVQAIPRALAFGGVRDPRAIAVLGAGLLGWYAQKVISEQLARNLTTFRKPVGVTQFSQTDVAPSIEMYPAYIPHFAGAGAAGLTCVWGDPTYAGLPPQYGLTDWWQGVGGATALNVGNPAIPVRDPQLDHSFNPPQYNAAYGRNYAPNLVTVHSLWRAPFSASQPHIFYGATAYPVQVFSGVQGGEASPAVEPIPLSYVGYVPLSVAQGINADSVSSPLPPVSLLQVQQSAILSAYAAAQTVGMPSVRPSYNIYVAPSGAVRTDARPHVLSKPSSGVRERKVKMNSASRAYYRMMSFYGRYTEARDFVDAVYKALPRDRRVTMYDTEVSWWRWIKDPKTGRPVRREFVKEVVIYKRKPSQAEKLQAIYNSWDVLDAQQAAANIFVQEAEDFAIAFKNTFNQPVARQLGLPVGLQYKGGVLKAAPSIAKDARGFYDLIK